ncbi:MAG: hypothetical protein H8E38_08045 [SAR324 cluster bacterium]|nr:hypothetical protein [SAR324 cluster bacterium]MBL7035197.1 hypothetical protein [SAR324 cluster bacterium]
MISTVTKICLRLLFAGGIIFLAGSIQAVETIGQTPLESAPALAENQVAQPTTVFGGVGRKMPVWQAGMDFFVLSNPHYSAFRNTLELRSHVYWGEWWFSDRWGIKGLLAEQRFKMFASSENQAESSTTYLGVLAKTQHLLTEGWKISAALGLARTVFSLGSQRKLGNSLVSEFRIGMELSEDFWSDAGILTMDSASGSGTGDQRLGSTGYLLGLSYGF